MARKTYSNEELLQALREYNKNIGFPTQRGLKPSEGYPNGRIYHERFGSFKNAILLAGLEIPENRKMYFDRESLNDKEMLKLLEYHTNEKLKIDTQLLTGSDIEEIKGMPSVATYVRRFGGIVDAYKKLGVDYYEFNRKKSKEKLEDDYHRLAKALGHAPHSRDLDRASLKGLTASAKTYAEHFGSILKTQVTLGYEPTNLGDLVTDEEILEGIIRLSEEIGDIPTQRDITECEYLPSLSRLASSFGTFRKTLIEAGFDEKEIRGKVRTTNNSNVCYSRYELLFCKTLENRKIKFEKDVKYEDYVSNLGKRYTCDFVAEIDEQTYFIEVFGITNSSSYDKRTEEKIRLCKENGLKLIEIYPEDIWGKTQDEIYEMLLDRINSLFD